MTTASVKLCDVGALIAAQGYQVTEADDLLQITDLDSGLTLTAAFADSVVFFSLRCVTVATADLTPEKLSAMLSSDNGISTSFFQTTDLGDGRTAISLNNYAKLQDLGADDQDDLEFCLESLFTDVIAARAVLS